MQITTVRPGLLVSFKTRIVGGVDYQRKDIDPEHDTEEGQRVSKWETTKVVRDPKEHTRAEEVRSKCWVIINRVCIRSGFGLLCPQAREAELRTALAEARTLADTFNETAVVTEIEVNMLVGRIADNDVEAQRAINSEIQNLMLLMRRGVQEADAKAIRDAARRAKEIGGMLSEESERTVTSAIREARAAASTIVRFVEKEGQAAEKVVESIELKALDQARFAFLDIDSGPTSDDDDPIVPDAPAVELEV